MVSIHALTRSATKRFLLIDNESVVSIHALTRSATGVGSGNGSINFVSIHALTRSATRSCEKSCIAKRFQSTHSRGVRHRVNNVMGYLASFNPRTHEECDSVFAKLGYSKPVSIHALTRSATCPHCGKEIELCFNPRTHEECDGICIMSILVLDCFNPRTHEECDILSMQIPLVRKVSIHALTRSAT